MKCPAAQINKLASEMADTTDPTVIQVALTVFARQLLKDACGDVALIVGGMMTKLDVAIGDAEGIVTTVEEYPDRFCF